MGYSLCMVADFENVSFLKYLVFYGAVSCRQQMQMIFRMDFDMFFGFLNFDRKGGFCMGYSLCIMANF